MAIRLDPKKTDDQGLPVVSWEEDRNLFAPDGVSPARVSCFIRRGENGVLQFVSAGLVRHGPFEEARPWEALAGFEVSSADQHYYSAGHRALLDVLASKSKSGVGRMLATDGASVILANFGDERKSASMHLNCADCTPVEADMLYERLHFEFVEQRDDLIAHRCGGRYVWPKDKPFVTHKPAVTAAPPHWWMKWLVDLVIVALLGLIAGGVYLLLR